MGAFRGSGSNFISPFKPKRAPLFIPRLLLGLDKVQGWESKVIRVYGFRLSVFRCFRVSGLGCRGSRVRGSGLGGLGFEGLRVLWGVKFRTLGVLEDDVRGFKELQTWDLGGPEAPSLGNLRGLGIVLPNFWAEELLSGLHTKRVL